MKIFSTFTGIGGFEIGIENAYNLCNELTAQASKSPESYEDLRQVRERETVSALPRDHSRVGSVDKTRRGVLSADVRWERPVCVGYSEIDKYAISIYEKHFPGVKNYGDITKINAKELPDFDCLVGGFPCQAFSIAGKRGGFDDTRGTLFFDLARILREKQPRYFVFENVKGLLSHDQGNTFRTIITTIDELGYDCQWSVLNSKDFGVPQNRERIIIVGHLRGTPRPEVFPVGGATESYSKELASTAVDANYFKGIDNHGQRTAIAVGTLRTHKDGNGFREVKSGVAPTIPARAREDGSGQPVVTDGIRIRRLTPLECERLQAFPDNWTRWGVSPDYQADETRLGVHMTHCDEGENEGMCKYGYKDTCPALNKTAIAMSDTQRYKMCGNAVTTNVIQAVFERIFASER